MDLRLLSQRLSHAAFAFNRMASLATAGGRATAIESDVNAKRRSDLKSIVEVIEVKTGRIV